MNTPNPKTLRGKIVWFFLSNTPGFLFFIILLVVALMLGQNIKEEKALLEETLKSAASADVPPVNVITLELSPRTLRETLNLPGSLEPWTRLPLMAKVQGSIEKVFVQEGEQVKKGQVIARIETKEYQIAVDAAKANYALAEANFARNKTLHSKGVAPQANFDEQQAQLRVAKAKLDEAELRLARCLITAPLDGLISRLDAKEGLVLNLGNIGEPVAEILAIDQVKAVVALPESDIPAVRKLKQIELTVQAVGDQRFLAPVHFLASAPTSQARAYRLELAVANTDHRLLPGMFIRAHIVKQVEEQALAVPLYAVISRNDEQFVYVEEEGLARRRDVEIGFLEGWQVLIRQGLQAGDRVIIEGHRSVEAGQRVQVVRSVNALEDLLP
jgi:membrane fusion protein, multidrug efflux system